MKITIRKIAELAGVSRGTVDKVLHGRPGVSNEVRAHVQAVMEEQGYRPVQHRKTVEETCRRLQLAVIIPRLTNPFFQAVKLGIEEVQFADPNCELHVDYYHCDGANISELLSILEYIERRGVDGIIMRGSQNRCLCDRINALADQNIPVVLVDSDIPGCRRLCMVGEDSITSGRVAASLLAKSIGGEGDVAIIGGLPDIAVHRARMQGFEQVIRERFPKIRIVETVYSFDQSVIAYKKTDMLLQQYTGLRGIFSVTGCTGDIGQAIMDRQAKNIKVISYNFTPDIVALIKKRIVDFTIGLSPYRQGVSAMRAMLRFLLHGETPESTFLEMPLLIGIDENIDTLSQNMYL